MHASYLVFTLKHNTTLNFRWGICIIQYSLPLHHHPQPKKGKTKRKEKEKRKEEPLLMHYASNHLSHLNIFRLINYF